MAGPNYDLAVELGADILDFGETDERPEDFAMISISTGSGYYGLMPPGCRVRQAYDHLKDAFFPVIARQEAERIVAEINNGFYKEPIPVLGKAILVPLDMIYQVKIEGLDF